MPRGCCCGENKYLSESDAEVALLREGEHAHGHRDFTIAGASRHYAPSFVLEPIHIVANLDVNIESKGVKAEVTTTVKCNAVPGWSPNTPSECPEWSNECLQALTHLVIWLSML